MTERITEDEDVSDSENATLLKGALTVSVLQWKATASGVKAGHVLNVLAVSHQRTIEAKLTKNLSRVSES